MWYLPPSHHMIGYQTGSLLLFAVAAMAYGMLRGHYSWPVAASLASGLGVTLVIFLFASRRGILHPLELVSAFFTGCAAFWIGNLASSRVRTTWVRIPLAIFGVCLATYAGGYVKAVGHTIASAHKEFVAGVVEEREKFGDAAFYQALFDAHPGLIGPVLKQISQSGLGDADGLSAMMQKLVTAQVSADLKRAPNDQIVAVFRANNSLIFNIAKNGFTSCMRSLNGQMSDAELLTFAGRPAVEGAAAAWAKLFSQSSQQSGAAGTGYKAIRRIR